MSDTCILIQTCDKYKFLWEGLELSWKLNWNWKEFPFRVFVLTEEEIFPAFSTLKGKHKDSGAKNFSSRLVYALFTLKTMGYSKLLYMQDDFWPSCTPDSSTVHEILKLLEREDIGCVHMNAYRTWYDYKFENTEIEVGSRKLKKFTQGSRFYYNHQACWWKIDELISIQNLGEEPYENEWKGTERAWDLNKNFYFLNYDWYTPEQVHHKGTLLDTAYKTINELRFRHNWENT